MCGICGTVGSADPELIEQMTALLAHRGPDGSGTRLFSSADGRPPAAFGHRRLAVIDPGPRAAQPFSDADERFWITYNGEIYDFRELRTELAAAGYPFETDCDTEVVLAAYRHWGDDCVAHLRGIFAFAIWDAQRGRLFLARDRLGIKPLYWTETDGRFLFASEPKALLPALGPVGIDHAALADFLTLLWVPDPDTLFEGIHKLPPGHRASVEDGRFRSEPYWDLVFEPDPGLEGAAGIAEIRRSVTESVRRQTVADVPLGSFFSGGIDSSAVAATLAETGENLSAYTVGFSERDRAHELVPDDVVHARALAGELGLDYNERILEPNVEDLLPRLAWHLDDPVADPATLTTYLISRSAREKLVVMLSGMGGDEVFAGYPRHLAAWLTRPAGLVPRPIRSGFARAISSAGIGAPGRLRGPRRNLVKLARGLDLPPLERYLAYCSYYRRDELDALLSPELRAALAGHEPLRRHREHAERVAGQHWLNQILYVDAKTFLPCLNLAYTDKMSMAASIEARVPLIDEQVVDVARRLPPSLKLRRGTRKYGFKKSMEGTLPDSVIWRRKAGFGAPIRGWLVNELRPMVDELLSPETVARRGLFDPDAVDALIHANDAYEADNALQIWTLLTLELWQQTFIDARSEAIKPRSVAA